MAQSKKKENKLLIICKEAKSKAEALKEVHDGENATLSKVGYASISYQLSLKLQELLQQSYDKEILEQEVDKIVNELKKEIMGILITESKFNEKEKKVAILLTELKPVADEIRDVTVKELAWARKTVGDRPLVDEADIEAIIPILTKLESLLEEEIDTRSTMEALVTKARKVARKLEKKD